LLYFTSIADIGCRIKLNTLPEYYKKLSNIIENISILAGLLIFSYRAFIEDDLIIRIIPFLIILIRNIWKYYEILHEDAERRQTKARASEELQFENLEEPVQIEMEAVTKT